MDVGIESGRIVLLAPRGSLATSGADIVDADDLVVAPGFVDLHTHYDAQLLWDPTASPSPMHGVTTVFTGNCGFGLAPVAGNEEYLARLMSKVEGIPLAALEAGLDWEWDGFGEYLARLDGRVGPNVGVLAGHSGIRRAIMGEAAVEREATEDEVVQMTTVLGTALRDGAMGFSTSQAPTHRDGAGDPVPSRAAAWDELRSLAAVCRDVEGTQIEIILPGCINGFSDDEMDLMADLSLLADRPVNWNVLAVTSLNPTGHVRQLEASTRAARRGATVKALTIPQGFQVRINFLSGLPLDALPGWGEIMSLPVDDRLVALADPDVRRRMDDGARSPDAGLIGALANWDILTFFECSTPETRRFEGRTVGEVAAEQDKDPFDALLDVVIADRLKTVAAATHSGRERRGLAPPGRVVGRRPHHRWGKRRRRPPRYVLRSNLQHHPDRRGRTRPRAALAA